MCESNIGDYETTYLPIEIWVVIFRFLDGPELDACQQVCSTWKQEITNMILTGRVGARGLRCCRLSLPTAPGGPKALDTNIPYDKFVLLEHRRRIWDSLCVRASVPVYLVGVGVFTPSGQTTICVDARPLEDDLRPIDTQTELDSCDEESGAAMTLFGKKGTKKPFKFLLEAGQWWEIVLNVIPEKNKKMGITGSEWFGSGGSGGCTAWSTCGRGSGEEIKVHGVTFEFKQTVREGWRSDVKEGQIPYFYFWRA